LSVNQTAIAQTTSLNEAYIDSLNDIGFAELTANPQGYEQVFAKALTVADSLSYTYGLAGINTQLSLIYTYLGKEDLRTEYRLNAIRLYEEIDSLKQAGFLYTELGWGFRRSDLKKATSYMRKGMSMLADYPGSIEQADAFNNYGIISLQNKEPDSALYFINRSLDIKKELKDTLGVAYSYSYLANVFMETGEFDKAIEHLEMSVDTRKLIGDISGISVDLVNIGMIHMNTGRLDLALENLKQSLNLAYQTSNARLAEFAFNTISNTYEEQGRYDSALTYYKSFSLFRDSLQNAETSERIAELEIQFQTEEKEKEIAQKTAALSQEQLRVKRRNLLAGIFGVLFISISFISVLFLRQQKIKRENLERENELQLQLANAEMENKLHQERERISRDLHDNVGSQITNLITGIEISNMHIQKDQQKDAKEILQNLDADARNTMTDLRETIWLLDKEEVPLEAFTDHLKGYFNRQKRYLNGMEVLISNEVKGQWVLNPTQSLNLMRIIQEALNNARKYAEASSFKVSLQLVKDQIEIKIMDDGTGMDLKESKEMGNGLQNMKERAELVGAKLAIRSAPGEGTTISIDLPNIPSSGDVS
jgi:signal transduction histidine kinase